VIEELLPEELLVDLC